MKKLKIINMFLVISAIFSSNTYAGCIQNNNKLGMVGLDRTVGLDSTYGSVFAKVSEHDNACGCDRFRFLQANTDTKMALSILLSARMSGNSVRIDIADPENCDSAYRVYIE